VAHGAASGTSGHVRKRPRVSFNSKNIWRRLEACEAVARAYGWHANQITSFSREVREAFSYEDAMAIIARNFEIVRNI
jgi:hypothetical protein